MIRNKIKLFVKKFWTFAFVVILAYAFNLIQDGPFRGCQRTGMEAAPTKICHTYPIMIKLGTVISRDILDKVFKNGPNKICRRQPLLKQTISLQIL